MSSNQSASKNGENFQYNFKEKKVVKAMMAANVECDTPLNVTLGNGGAAKIVNAMGMQNDRTIRRALGRFMQENGLSAGSE